eukprot:8973906-Pyramimonas_sp.AAC.1
MASCDGVAIVQHLRSGRGGRGRWPACLSVCGPGDDLPALEGQPPGRMRSRCLFFRTRARASMS